MVTGPAPSHDVSRCRSSLSDPAVVTEQKQATELYTSLRNYSRAVCQSCTGSSSIRQQEGDGPEIEETGRREHGALQQLNIRNDVNL